MAVVHSKWEQNFKEQKHRSNIDLCAQYEAKFKEIYNQKFREKWNTGIYMALLFLLKLIVEHLLSHDTTCVEVHRREHIENTVF